MIHRPTRWGLFSPFSNLDKLAAAERTMAGPNATTTSAAQPMDTAETNLNFVERLSGASRSTGDAATIQ